MYKLSNEQKRIWTITQINQSSAWTQLLFKRFKGELDISRLKNALITFLDLQEQLKANYIVNNYEVVQVIDDTANLDRYFSMYDFSHLKDKENQLSIFLEKLRKRVYQLDKDPLYQLIVVKMSEDVNIITQVFHHAIFDATSIHLFWEQLEQIYLNGYIDGIGKYTDYTKKQLDCNMDSMKRFWTSQLSGLNMVATHLFPLKEMKEELELENELPIYEIDMNLRLIQDINRYAFLNKISSQAIYLTALSLLVYKYSQVNDFCVGTFLSGRNNMLYKNTIGFFMKTLPVRVTIYPNNAISTLINQVNRFLLEMYANQDYPLSNIIEDLGIERNLDEHPLFSIVFNRVVSNNKIRPTKFGEVIEIPFHTDINFANHNAFYNFNLSILLNESKERSILTFWYKPQYFCDIEMRRFAKNYITTLQNIITESNQSIKNFGIISQTEYHTLFSKWNQTNLYGQADDHIFHYFIRAVNQNGDRIAIVDGETRITYKELNQKVNECALRMLEYGVKEKSRVAIVLPRGFIQVVSIFAIFKLNCSYVPIDIEYPLQRVQYIINDASISMIITEEKVANKMNFLTSKCILLDKECNQCMIEEQSRMYSRDDEAYVIYTSGSTGNPKGIAIKHSNVMRLLRMAEVKMKFSNRDGWTYFHSISFDFSVWEILGAILFGGRLIIVNDECRYSTEKFTQLIKNEKITVLNQTPYALQMLLNYDPNVLDDVRITLLSADKFEPTILRDWAKKRKKIPRIVNTYGITETTILVTHHEVTYDELVSSNISNIGKPYPDLKLYVLDHEMNPVPIGVVGELYVSGPGLANKYIGDVQNSKTGFYKSPFETEMPYSIIYKTGDLVYYLENGDLVYIGRNDNQIQFHGYRIELGEIYSELRKISDIKDCVVCKRDVLNQEVIVAYIVLRDKKFIDTDRIVDSLKKKLPAYMIPSIFQTLDNIPISANGKVDIKQLPNITYRKSEVKKDESTSIEDILLQLWCKYLKKDIYNITEDFFEVGGTSMNVLLIKQELEGVYNIDIPVIDFYRFRTIKELANHIEKKQ